MERFNAAEASGVFPTTDRERAQERLIAKWAESLPAAQRRRVKCLPSLSPAPGTGMEKDAAEWQSASFSRDMAAEVDSLADELMERFGLSAAQAAGVAAWHEEAERMAAVRVRSQVLWRILGRLLGQRVNDVWVVLWALAFQTGMSKYLTSQNPKAKSEEMGWTRALLSHHMGKWDKVFEDMEVKFRDETFRKSQAARVKYREARLRVVAREKHLNGVN